MPRMGLLKHAELQGCCNILHSAALIGDDKPFSTCNLHCKGSHPCRSNGRIVS
jgi:hypothetical protein